MKLNKIVLSGAIFAIVVSFSACTTSTVKPALEQVEIVGKTITLVQDTNLLWEGTQKYIAKQGDTVKIVLSQPCKLKPKKECWIVNHDEHGRGVMIADRNLLQ